MPFRGQFVPCFVDKDLSDNGYPSDKITYKYIRIDFPIWVSSASQAVATIESHGISILDYTHLNQYGVIVINTHGGLDDAGNYLLGLGPRKYPMSQYQESGEWSILSTGLSNGTIIRDRQFIGNAGITGTGVLVPIFVDAYTATMGFFTGNNSNLPNSIVFLGSCLGWAGRDTFLNLGAKAFLGWDAPVRPNYVGIRAQRDFFTGMAKNENNVADAYKNISCTFDPVYGSDLNLTPDTSELCLPTDVNVTVRDIPAGCTRVTIHVYKQGTTQEVVNQLSFAPASTEVTKIISNVPIGSVTVKAMAYDSGDTLISEDSIDTRIKLTSRNVALSLQDNRSISLGENQTINIVAGGTGSATVTATVINTTTSLPQPNVRVNFTITGGSAQASLSASQGTTDASGVASVTLTSPLSTVTVKGTIAATSTEASCQYDFTNIQNVSLQVQWLKTLYPGYGHYYTRAVFMFKTVPGATRYKVEGFCNGHHDPAWWCPVPTPPDPSGHLDPPTYHEPAMAQWSSTAGDYESGFNSGSYSNPVPITTDYRWVGLSGGGGDCGLDSVEQNLNDGINYYSNRFSGWTAKVTALP